MNIALLDDDSRENDNLSSLIEQYALEKNCEIRCTKFTSGKKLLESEKFDLYFLDYVMEEMDGVAVGLALQKKYNGAVSIIYLTGIEAAAADVINAQISALGFLKKPVSPPLLFEKLDRLYRVSFGGRLQLKKGRVTETVFAQEILYAEAADKRTRVHFRVGEETYHHAFSEMERILAGTSSFYRIHRSYIVNMLHVKSYDAKNVMMDNGDVLPLKAKDFAKVYRNYVFNEIK